MGIHPEAQDGTVAVGEASIPFYDTGEPGDSRPTVVLVHGTGGTALTHFRTLFPMFATGYRVIALDLQEPEGQVERQLEGQQQLELEDLAAQVRAVMDERSPQSPVHLLGYSLGALVAATVAAQSPASVQTLTLVAGWVRVDGDQRLRNRIWAALKDADPQLLREFATWTAFGQPYLGQRTDAELEALIRARTTTDGASAQMDLNRRADLSEVLAQISAPTLVVAAAFDKMVPARQTELLYGGISDARYATIDTGHAVTAERPAQLFQLVHGFISDPALIPADRAYATAAV